MTNGLTTNSLMLRVAQGRDVHLSDEDWTELEASVDAELGGYAAKLKSSWPGIKEKDLRICMLRKLGLTYMQIAKLFFLQPASVKKRMQRLRKQCFLQQN